MFRYYQSFDTNAKTTPAVYSENALKAAPTAKFIASRLAIVTIKIGLRVLFRTISNRKVKEMKRKSITVLAILIAAVATSDITQAQGTHWDWDDPAAGAMGWSSANATAQRHENGYLALSGFQQLVTLSQVKHAFTSEPPESLTIDLQMSSIFSLAAINVEVYGADFHHAYSADVGTYEDLGNYWKRFTLIPTNPGFTKETSGMELNIAFEGLHKGVNVDDFGDIATPTPVEAGTGFTWQGKLNDNGDPADGEYDFEFKLYDPAGRQYLRDPDTLQDIVVTHEDVPVSRGYFTVRLDFGDVFNNRQRLLEIAVRPGDSTGTYTTILPRQEVTPAPHALYAQKGPYTGVDPVYVDEDFKIGLNSTSGARSLMAWNGSSWVARTVDQLRLQNVQPFLGIYHCIALTGVFPSRNSSQPYIGEIMPVGFGFAPRGWAFCDGQLLPISQNTALFSLLGTTFGGDGRTTFGLPDLRGRGMVHPGNGPGLPSRTWGQKSGSHQVTAPYNF